MACSAEGAVACPPATASTGGSRSSGSTTHRSTDSATPPARASCAICGGRWTMTSVDAVVLTGRPGFFSAGADITEFGTPKSAADPNLPAVIAALESAGQAGGGGDRRHRLRRRPRTRAGRALPRRHRGKQGRAAGGDPRHRARRGRNAAAAAGAPRAAGRRDDHQRGAAHRRGAGACRATVVRPDRRGRRRRRRPSAFATEVAATRPLPRVRDLDGRSRRRRAARRRCAPG